MNKRGSIEELGFTIFGIIAGLIVLVTSMIFVVNISNDTDFKERYLVIDIGLLIEAMHASPGDLEVSYNLADLYDLYSTDSDNQGSYVLIKKNKNGIGKRFYYLGGKVIKIENKDISDIDSILLMKKYNDISVSRNLGDN